MNTNARPLTNEVSFTMRPKQMLRMAFNQVLLLVPAILMAWPLITQSENWGSERYLFIFLDICLFLLAAAGLISIFRARLTFSKEGVHYRSIRNISSGWADVKRISEEKDSAYLIIEKHNDRGQPLKTRIPLSWFAEVDLNQKLTSDPVMKSLRGFAPHIFQRK